MPFLNATDKGFVSGGGAFLASRISGCFKPLPRSGRESAKSAAIGASIRTEADDPIIGIREENVRM